MLRLALILHSVIATTLMGIGVIVVLVIAPTGAGTQAGGMEILIGAGVGVLLSIPISWLVARAISNMRGGTA